MQAVATNRGIKQSARHICLDDRRLSDFTAKVVYQKLRRTRSLSVRIKLGAISRRVRGQLKAACKSDDGAAKQHRMLCQLRGIAWEDARKIEASLKALAKLITHMVSLEFLSFIVTNLAVTSLLDKGTSVTTIAIVRRRRPDCWTRSRSNLAAL